MPVKWVHRLQGLVFMTFCALPVLLIVSLACGFSLWNLLGAALPGLCAASFLSAFFPNRYRIIGIVLLPLLAAGELFLLGAGLFALIAACITLALHIATLAMSHRFDADLMTAGLLAAGGGFYAGAYVLLYLLGWQAHVGPLAPFCGLYLVYCVLLLNYTNLRHASGRPGRPASAILRGNVLMSAAFVALGVVLINIEALKDGFFQLLSTIIMAILYLMTLLTPSGMGGEPDGGGSPELGLPEAENTMPAWLDALLTVVMWVVAAAILAGLLFLAARVIVRLLRALWARLKAWLFMPPPQDAADYIDERSILLRSRTQSAPAAARRGFFSRLFNRPRWSALGSRERIRYVMQRLLYHGKRPYRPFDTAHEALEESEQDFASLYDRARYSDLPITDEQAEQARRYLP